MSLWTTAALSLMMALLALSLAPCPPLQLTIFYWIAKGVVYEWEREREREREGERPALGASAW